MTAASEPDPPGATPTEATVAPVQTPASPPEPASASADAPFGDDAAKRAQLEAMLRRLEATLPSRATGPSLYPELDATLERIRLGREKAL
ncbi:MAG: hypothetical protein OXU81_12820, partial [Gammaproteobacteria bacterium]|nr:hypothetical protein [Gammaproteobacteria bacterium]